MPPWSLLSVTTDQQFQEFLLFCQHRIENYLKDLFKQLASHAPLKLHQAMEYCVLGPGKRIRPMLVFAAGQALSVPVEKLTVPAAAVELIHAYSLVHDDLPAMDDDDLRRGRATCHVQYDEATAILAGDALQTLAFQLLSGDQAEHFSAKSRIDMMQQLAFASGSRGMCGGQAIDLDSVGRQLDLAQLENMHIHKTGALIRASVQLGALAADNANEKKIKQLDHYAKCIGLAFQIHDDILDVEGNTETLGKTRGKDAANDKPTYPGLMGLEAAREKAADLIEDALEQLADFDHKADPLRGLAEYIVRRNH